MHVRRLGWIGFALISAAGFAVMAACVRVAAAELLPQAEVVFFRNFMALIVLLPLLGQHRVTLRTRRFGLHLLRATAGLSAMYFYFFALAHLPLADALLLNYTSPLFVAAIAAAGMLVARERTEPLPEPPGGVPPFGRGRPAGCS